MNPKCNGIGCVIKNKCLRFTESIPTKNKEPYFAYPPFQIVHGKFECKMFHGDNAELLLEELKSIMKK